MVFKLSLSLNSAGGGAGRAVSTTVGGAAAGAGWGAGSGARCVTSAGGGGVGAAAGAGAAAALTAGRFAQPPTTMSAAAARTRTNGCSRRIMASPCSTLVQPTSRADGDEIRRADRQRTAFSACANRTLVRHIGPRSDRTDDSLLLSVANVRDGATGVRHDASARPPEIGHARRSSRRARARLGGAGGGAAPDVPREASGRGADIAGQPAAAGA